MARSSFRFRMLPLGLALAASIAVAGQADDDSGLSLEQLKGELKELRENSARINGQIDNYELESKPADVVTMAKQKPYLAAVRPQAHEFNDFLGHLENQALRFSRAETKKPAAVPANLISIAPPAQDDLELAEEKPVAMPEAPVQFVAPPRSIHAGVPAEKHELKPTGRSDVLQLDSIHGVSQLQSGILSGSVSTVRQNMAKNALNAVGALGNTIYEGLKAKNMRFRVGERVKVFSPSRGEWLGGVVKDVLDEPEGTVKVLSPAGPRVISPSAFFNNLRKDEAANKIDLRKVAVNFLSSLHLGESSADPTGSAAEDPLHEVTKLQQGIVKGEIKQNGADITANLPKLLPLLAQLHKGDGPQDSYDNAFQKYLLSQGQQQQEKEKVSKIAF